MWPYLTMLEKLSGQFCIYERANLGFTLKIENPHFSTANVCWLWAANWTNAEKWLFWPSSFFFVDTLCLSLLCHTLVLGYKHFSPLSFAYYSAFRQQALIRPFKLHHKWSVRVTDPDAFETTLLFVHSEQSRREKVVHLGFDAFTALGKMAIAVHQRQFFWFCSFAFYTLSFTKRQAVCKRESMGFFLGFLHKQTKCLKSLKVIKS